MRNTNHIDTIEKYEYQRLPHQDNELNTNKENINKKSNKHDSHEEHDHTIKSDETLSKLKIASFICLIFMILEVIGGYLANSIAIMSDAAHLLSDLLGFIISIVSIYISRKRANHKMSFGYHRAEVIGALVSVCLIWGLTIWLLFEASSRLVSRKPVDGFIMLITAIIGFIFNIVMGLILAYQGIDHHLHHHHDEDEHGDHDHHQHTHEKKEHKHNKNEKHHHSHEHEHDSHHDDHIFKHEQETEKKKHQELTIGLADDNMISLGETHAKEIGSDLEKHNNSEKKKDKENKERKHSHDHHKSHSPGHKEKKNGHSHSHHGHSHDNLNLRASLIHVIGDAVQNLGVVIAGLIIYFYPEYSIADPICTFVFSIIVAFTTVRILKEGISVLMEATPVEINLKNLEKELKGIPHVVEIHDLHVWSLSPGKLSLSCHLISTLPQDSLKAARNHLKTKYKITHSTIQVELDSGDAREDCSHDLHQEFSLNSIS